MLRTSLRFGRALCWGVHVIERRFRTLSGIQPIKNHKINSMMRLSNTNTNCSSLIQHNPVNSCGLPALFLLEDPVVWLWNSWIPHCGSRHLSRYTWLLGSYLVFATGQTVPLCVKDVSQLRKIYSNTISAPSLWYGVQHAFRHCAGPQSISEIACHQEID